MQVNVCPCAVYLRKCIICDDFYSEFRGTLLKVNILERPVLTISAVSWCGIGECAWLSGMISYYRTTTPVVWPYISVGLPKHESLITVTAYGYIQGRWKVRTSTWITVVSRAVQRIFRRRFQYPKRGTQFIHRWYLAEFFFIPKNPTTSAYGF